jgi:hypothetical protein
LHGVCKGFRRCSYGRGYRTILAQFSQLWRRSRTILAHGQAILALFSHLGWHSRTILAHSRTSLALGRQFRPMCLHCERRKRFLLFLSESGRVCLVLVF